MKTREKLARMALVVDLDLYREAQRKLNAYRTSPLGGIDIKKHKLEWNTAAAMGLMSIGSEFATAPSPRFSRAKWHREALEEIERLKDERASLRHRLGQIEDARRQTMGTKDNDFDDIPALARALGQRIVNQRAKIEWLTGLYRDLLRHAQGKETESRKTAQETGFQMEQLRAEIEQLKAAGERLAAYAVEGRLIPE